MPFTYTVFNLARYFREYYNIFLNKLASSGIGVTSKSIENWKANIKVQTTDEVGEIELRVEGNDIIVRFETGEAPHKRGLEAIRTGLGFIGEILTGGSLLDASIDIAEQSIDSALSGQHGYLASTIASIARDSGEELRRRIETSLPPPPPAPGISIDESYLSLLEEVRSRMIGLREEVEIARQERKDVKRIDLRLSHVEKLFNEAQNDAQRGDYSLAKSKLNAANRILDRVERLINELYEV
ncbi:MAG TPA: hypothetical protein ENG40_00210 [Thermoprotei archaeon]|nr:hypothetical protein [Thermoprotei archaeon]